MIKPKAKSSILALIFLSLAFSSAGTAHAVIPQLLGPLSALLSIVPQILAVVGIAFLTAFVFARDWLKGIFYRIRESVSPQDSYSDTPSRHHWCWGLGYLWKSTIRSTVCHNNGWCSA